MPDSNTFLSLKLAFSVGLHAAWHHSGEYMAVIYGCPAECVPQFLQNFDGFVAVICLAPSMLQVGRQGAGQTAVSEVT